ncbi:MAG: ABC transporter permease [Planctomycetota bacterium]|nr:MAG: ABC transporter permease [Planctomycetota bacterium]GDY08556.1 ABC transporter permease [Planctomycetia bacterium]
MKRLVKAALPPAVLFVIVIAAWHYMVVGFGIKAFLLPKPIGVWNAAVENRSELLIAIGLTAGAALCGFVSSLLIGSLTACVFSQSKMIRSSCYPYAIFLQTVPIVAVAPLIVVWFGAEFRSVVLVSFIISLFPIVTNVTTGMLAIDPDLLDLFRLYRASRWQLLWKLRLPHSVPFLVTGARTSSGMAVVGAIVGEFFAGIAADRHGLGYIIFAAKDQNNAKMFAAVIASTLLGITIFGVSTLIGSTVLSRWSDPKGGGHPGL